MITLETWIKNRAGSEILELPNFPINDQLKKIEDSNTGVGFVFILTLVTTDESEDPQATHALMTSIPIIKVHNNWMTIEDENVADIMSAIIRLVVPGDVVEEQAKE